MKAQNIIFIPLVLSLLFLTVQAMEATELREDVRQVRYFDPPRVTDEELQLFSPAFLAEIAFKADPDIPLDVELQRLVHDLCKDTHPDLTPELVFAVIEQESDFVWPGAVMDANGLYSAGYMQVNEPHWQRLADMGIDIHTKAGSIQGGVQILSELLEDYPLEKALVVYQCGESGAEGIESTEYSRGVLKGAK